MSPKKSTVQEPVTDQHSIVFDEKHWRETLLRYGTVRSHNSPCDTWWRVSPVKGVGFLLKNLRIFRYMLIDIRVIDCDWGWFRLELLCFGLSRSIKSVLPIKDKYFLNGLMQQFAKNRLRTKEQFSGSSLPMTTALQAVIAKVQASPFSFLMAIWL